MRAFNAARQALIADLQAATANLHDESWTSVQDLIKINELGMLTTDSQQGRIVYGQVPNDRELHAKLWKRLDDKHWRDHPERPYEQVLDALDTQYRRRGGRYHRGITEKEKAYLTGFLPVGKAQELVQILDQMDNLVAWQVPFQPETIVTRTFVTYVPTTQQGEYSRFDRFPLVGGTHLNTYPIPFSQNEYGERVGARAADDHKFSMVSVQDARFGHAASSRDGLFARVRQALKQL